MNKMPIYHITTRREWELTLASGFYSAPSLTIEGFIHCSEEHQVANTRQRYFDGMTGLVKLTIDPEKLTSPLIREWSPSSKDTFPHIYGAINRDAVTSIDLL